MMRLASLVCIIGVTQIAMAVDNDSGAHQKDAEARKALVGVWKGRVHNGATGHELTFATTLITGVKDGTRDLGKGSFKLDLTKNPHWMDATEIKSTGSKGRVYFGIYRLERDSLTWCVGTSKRPTTFETGNGQFMLILKRQKHATPRPTAGSRVPPRAAGPGKHTVTTLDQSAPETLSAKVRSLLNSSGLRIAGPNGDAVCDVWLRTNVPVLSASRKRADRKYPVESGTLLGAVRIAKEGVGDFRNLKSRPGVYTLRYGLQPKDDLHEPTVRFQDFLVLLAAAEDTDPIRISDAAELSKRGIKTTGETHPAILYLSPPHARRMRLPAIVHSPGSNANTNLEILVAKTTTEGGGRTKFLQIELVVAGSAKE